MNPIPDANDLAALRRDCEACLARLARHESDTESYWQQADELAEDVRAMWVSDARSAHVVAVDVWSVFGDGNALDEGVDLHPQLDGLRGRLGVVVSELRGRHDPVGRALLAAWERDGRQLVEAFAAFASALGALRDAELSTAERQLVASLPVLKTGLRRFELFCATCGKAAVTFEIGPHVASPQPTLLCKGIVWQQSFDTALADPLFEMLDRGAVGEAHDFLVKTGECPEGIDAWCPACARVYCKLHFACEDKYDDGFYDCTYGTCPAGHRRCIAD